MWSKRWSFFLSQSGQFRSELEVVRSRVSWVPMTFPKRQMDDIDLFWLKSKQTRSRQCGGTTAPSADMALQTVSQRENYHQVWRLPGIVLGKRRMCLRGDFITIAAQRTHWSKKEHCLPADAFVGLALIPVPFNAGRVLQKAPNFYEVFEPHDWMWGKRSKRESSNHSTVDSLDFISLAESHRPKNNRISKFPFNTRSPSIPKNYSISQPTSFW